MSRARLFRCVECGDDVVATKGAARSSEYALGVHLPVRDTFELPTCRGCGEVYLTAALEAKLRTAQRPAYEAWLKAHARELLDLLVERHHTTRRHLAALGGWTPAYLSHVGSETSKRVPSLTLVRHLEALASAPHEVERLLAGRPWEEVAHASMAALNAPLPASPYAQAGPYEPPQYAVTVVGLVEPSNDIAA